MFQGRCCRRGVHLSSLVVLLPLCGRGLGEGFCRLTFRLAECQECSAVCDTHSSAPPDKAFCHRRRPTPGCEDALDTLVQSAGEQFPLLRHGCWMLAAEQKCQKCGRSGKKTFRSLFLQLLELLEPGTLK